MVAEDSEASQFATQVVALHQENGKLAKKLEDANLALSEGTQALHNQYAERVRSLEQECSALRVQLEQKAAQEQWQMEKVRLLSMVQRLIRF